MELAYSILITASFIAFAYYHDKTVESLQRTIKELEESHESNHMVDNKPLVGVRRRAVPRGVK